MFPPDFTETYYFLQLGLSKSAEIAFFPYFHLTFVPVNSKILLPPVEIYITFQSNASLNTSSSWFIVIIYNQFCKTKPSW